MDIHLYQQYKAAEVYIESLNNITRVDFFAGTSNPRTHFARAQHLLKLAGQLDKSLKIIHVAGTSGKGTVVNLIYNILREAGYKVGAHFSPFVSVATEKIQINNRFISPREFIDLVDEIKPIIERCAKTLDTPSHFEIWLLLSLLYFKKQNCDYVVLETGCGGRYDATNAIFKPLISIITNIGLDHAQILGKTYAKIAYEKAGIIRQRSKVFTAAQRPSALKVIESVCDKKNADLTIVQSDFPNETLATAVAEFLEIKSSAIKTGIKVARLPARFEIVSRNPLIILDGAHNSDKIAFLTEKLAKIKYHKLHLLCALTNSRSPRDVFRPLIAKASYIYATRFLTNERKAIPPKILLKNLQLIKKIPGITFLDPNLALETALKNAKRNDLILITGSFFLCGDLRNNFVPKIWQLENRKNFKLIK